MPDSPRFTKCLKILKDWSDEFYLQLLRIIERRWKILNNLTILEWHSNVFQTVSWKVFNTVDIRAYHLNDRMLHFFTCRICSPMLKINTLVWYRGTQLLKEQATCTYYQKDLLNGLTFSIITNWISHLTGVSLIN